MRKYEYPLPRMVFSRCLGFDACRYNGLSIRSDAVNALKCVCSEVITDCPEVEIGLGVPRPTIRIVFQSDEKQVIQPQTGRDVTELMREHTLDFFSNVGDVDGFVLKNRSPSCGIKAVKYYHSADDNNPFERGTGLFGGMILEGYPYTPVEDEGRLKDFTIRYNFYTKVFTRAFFREVNKSGRLAELVRFHAVNKYLFMAYNQSALREMGRIVANHDGRTFEAMISDYEKQMNRLFSQNARKPSNINVLQHCMGYFKDQLNSEEKQFFLDLLDGYRKGKKPLSTPVEILRSWILRFGNEYLRNQRFFQPFPWELIESSTVDS